jgi:hypothetical protein
MNGVRFGNWPARSLAVRRGPAGGSAVDADAAGHPTELRLQAKITISDDGQTVIVENIPPNISTDAAAASIAMRAEETSDLSRPAITDGRGNSPFTGPGVRATSAGRIVQLARAAICLARSTACCGLPSQGRP